MIREEAGPELPEKSWEPQELPDYGAKKIHWVDLFLGGM